VLENPHAPTATVLGTLRAGSACVTDGRFAVAGLTAAMLDRGTRRFSRLELASELEDHGLHLGVRPASSAPASVTVSAAGLAEELPRLLELLAEVLRRPTFPASELDRLRDRVRAALVRERDDTSSQAFAALSRRLYPPGHPLHRRPIEERLAELDGLTVGDLESFHRRAYGPASLVLAVVGAVDPDEVHTLLSAALEGWDGGLGQLPEWPEVADPEPAEDLVPMAERPNLDVLLGHPGRLRRTDPDVAAALLANSCLGQSTLTSRLGGILRDREGLTYGVYSRFFGTRDLPGPWAVFLGVAPENLRRAVALCREVVERYVAEGPTEQELADEREALAGGYRVGLATNSGVARELAAALAHGGGVAWLDEHPRRLLAATRDEVHRAVRRHIRPQSLVLAAAGSLPEEGSAT
jgi:zinc protease